MNFAGYSSTLGKYNEHGSSPFSNTFNTTNAFKLIGCYAGSVSDWPSNT